MVASVGVLPVGRGLMVSALKLALAPAGLLVAAPVCVLCEDGGSLSVADAPSRAERSLLAMWYGLGGCSELDERTRFCCCCCCGGGGGGGFDGGIFFSRGVPVDKSDEDELVGETVDKGCGVVAAGDVDVDVDVVDVDVADVGAGGGAVEGTTRGGLGGWVLGGCRAGAVDVVARGEVGLGVAASAIGGSAGELVADDEVEEEEDENGLSRCCLRSSWSTCSM